MEISRREQGRSFRSPRFGANSEQLVNYNPWNKRYSPIDPDYQPEMSHSFRQSHRAPRPYQRNHPAQRLKQASTNSNNIPSLLNLEIPPQPLFLPQEVEQLRANLRNLNRRLEPERYELEPEPYGSEPEPYGLEPEPYGLETEPYGLEREPYEAYDECDDSPPTGDVEYMTDEEYMREEQKTKQQIEEIIAVAQALREKLDREEELRRQAEQQSIPKLMDLKPKIPSLLEIYVPPPVIPEETCWNCKGPGHRFTQCNMPQQRKFCYRCGTPGFDVASCPSCKASR